MSPTQLMNRLFLYGTDFRHVDPTHLGAFADALRSASESLPRHVLLATCNRVEVYVETDDPQAVSEHLRAAIAHRWPVFEKNGIEVVRHLIRVAGSLESMVLGENQILGQVKSALQTAKDEGHGSSLLDELIQAAIRGAREIRNSTGLGTRPVSVASLGARHLATRVPTHRARRVVIVGAGQMARKAAPALRDTGAELVFVNRTIESARALAEEHGGTALSLDEFVTNPPQCDGMFVAVRGNDPVVNAELIAKIDVGSRGLTIVDVCVPCAVADDVRELDHVDLLDMDGLRDISSANAAERREAARNAEPIVEKQANSFANRLRQRELGLADIRRAHIDLADQRIRDILDAELASLDEGKRQRIHNRLVTLAKAHAHLHLASLKQQVSA